MIGREGMVRAQARSNDRPVAEVGWEIVDRSFSCRVLFRERLDADKAMGTCSVNADPLLIC